MTENTLYFGDNLKILRDNIRDETFDLIYLDPPFNSKSQLQRAVSLAERPRAARATRSIH